MGEQPPAEITQLARRRTEARRAGDFVTADALRTELEAAGWKVVDSGYDYRLEPARPSDIEVGGERFFGSSASVPSRLEEAPAGSATLVLAAPPSSSPPAFDRVLEDVPPDTQVVVVVDGPPEAEAEVQAPAGTEVVRMAPPVGLAGCWNAGLRRASGEVVIVVPPGIGVSADAVAGAGAALADPDVAVAGSAGRVSHDLRHWRPDEGPEVDALGVGVLAFRRSDVVARGPLDERFVDAELLCIWWSLLLRDAGPGEQPRRGLRLSLGPSSPPPGNGPPRDRAARRDFYRIIDRFGQRYDLLRDPLKPTREEGTARRR